MDSVSVLNPASPEAREILHLFFFVLIVAGVIFGIVASLVVYISVRFRHREGDPEPRQVSENPLLEIVWTAIPILILLAIFVATVRVMHEVSPPAQGHAPDLRIVAHQWWWELHYPKSGAISANEIHLPVGKRLLIQLNSADVIHDFWVPSLGKKVDAIPNHTNFLWLTIDKPGVYLGTCDEFCGAEHAWMRIRVVGQTPEDYAKWARRQSEPPAGPETDEEKAGARLFQAKTCSNCHAILGTDAKGDVGPDLSHVGGRATLASGVLTNTPEHLARWLRDPQAVKEGCNMPNLKLSKPEIRDLVAYLEALK